jgi:hypothetical protein
MLLFHTNVQIIEKTNNTVELYLPIVLYLRLHKTVIIQ